MTLAVRLEMDALWHDLRQALRAFLAKPAFTIVAVMTLALGIGANTAIFSAVSALLWRPLPVPDADRVVSGISLREGFDPFGTSLLSYSAFRGSAAFASCGVTLQRFYTLTGRDEPERLRTAAVTAGYLSSLGVNPIAGRSITPDDDRPGAAPVAVISHDLWQRRFGGTAAVIGQQLPLDDGVYTVVGVMPRGFDMPRGAALWVPLRIDVDTVPLEQKTPTTYGLIARLATGVTLAQADAEVKQVARRLEEKYPQSNRGWTYRLITLRQDLLGDLAGRNRRALLTLEAAVGFLLLICCANVANLLLVRGVAREREVAVRLALGARRARVVRQLLTESAVLAIAGGVAGLLLAVWLTPVLAILNPIQAGSFATFLTDFAIDRRVMLFAFAASLCTGIVFGIVPALKASRAGDLMAALKRREQRTSGGTSRRWLSALVVVEITVSVTLLVNGSLIVQSFARLQRVDLGFDPAPLLTMEFTLPAQRSGTNAARVAAVDRIVERVRAVPGVTAAGVTTNIPLQLFSFDSTFTVEGRPPVNPADVPITAHRLVTSNYLETLGVHLVKGRLLDEHDTEATQPVVVITEEFARQAFPGDDAIGRHVRRGRATDTRFPWMTVVGVVADVKEDSFNFRVARPAWYLPYAQVSASPATLNLLVRATGNASAVASEVRSAIRSVDNQQAVTPAVTMTGHVSGILVTERFSAVLMTTLASVGLFLAACGLYGVMAYSSSQRTGEIGLRMALGATRRDVIALVMRQGASIVAIGLLAGVALARALSVILTRTLYGVNADDPFTFGAVSIVLAAVNAAACYLPARRATRVDPLVALRTE
jgi:putative ABC transport system permease protein